MRLAPLHIFESTDYRDPCIPQMNGTHGAYAAMTIRQLLRLVKPEVFANLETKHNLLSCLVSRLARCCRVSRRRYRELNLE